MIPPVMPEKKPAAPDVHESGNRLENGKLPNPIPEPPLPPRSIRNAARTEHTGHHARNLHGDGPGDRHVHQIGKEQYKQRAERRQRHFPRLDHLFPYRLPAGIHTGIERGKGFLSPLRRVGRIGPVLQESPPSTVRPFMGRLKLFQFTPLVDVLLWYLKPFKLLHLCGNDFRLELQGKAVLPRQFLDFLVKFVFVAREFGQALLFLFLRLPQIKIALEPGFNFFLLLKLIGLLGADALFIGVFCGLFVDLFQRLFIVGKDLDRKSVV